MLLVMFATEHI